MNIIKQEKAITMVSLVIIIVLLFIILGVSLYYGSNDIDTTIDGKLSGELKMVQQAVLQQYVKYKSTLNDEYIVGTNYNNEIQSFITNNYSEINLVYTVTDSTEKIKSYYLLTPVNLETIGIKDSQYSYIVNYYTGEVLNADIYATSSEMPLYVNGLTSTDIQESF